MARNLPEAPPRSYWLDLPPASRALCRRLRWQVLQPLDRRRRTCSSPRRGAALAVEALEQGLRVPAARAELVPQPRDGDRAFTPADVAHRRPRSLQRRRLEVEARVHSHHGPVEAEAGAGRRPRPQHTRSRGPAASAAPRAAGGSSCRAPPRTAGRRGRSSRPAAGGQEASRPSPQTRPSVTRSSSTARTAVGAVRRRQRARPGPRDDVVPHCRAPPSTGPAGGPAPPVRSNARLPIRLAAPPQRPPAAPGRSGSASSPPHARGARQLRGEPFERIVAAHRAQPFDVTDARSVVARAGIDHTPPPIVSGGAIWRTTNRSPAAATEAAPRRSCAQPRSRRARPVAFQRRNTGRCLAVP